MQVVENGQGLLPGLRRLAGRVLTVAEVSKGFRFMDAVAEFAGEAEGALIAGGGFGEVAQMELGVCQVVPGSSLKPAVAAVYAG